MPTTINNGETRLSVRTKINDFMNEYADAATGRATLNVNGSADDMTELDTRTDISAGDYIRVESAYNNEPETFKLVAAATYTANSQEVYDLTASGLQAVSTRTWFQTVAHLLADPRGYSEFSAGDILEAAGFRYEVAASGASDEHVTTAGGVKLYVADERMTPYHFGAIGDGTTDDTTALQAFFDADPNYPNAIADWYGTWKVSSKITVDGSHTSVKRYVAGRLVANGVTGDVLYLKSINKSFWSGIVTVTHAAAETPVAYANRTFENGVVIGGSVWARFDGFRVSGAIRHGVKFDRTAGTNQIDAKLGYIFCTDCGSASYDDTNSYLKSYSFTARTDSGSSFSQRSELTISGGTDVLEEGDYLRIDDAFYLIKSVDSGAGTVSVFPWLADLAKTSGTIYSAHGGAVQVSNSNTASVEISSIYAQRVGVVCDLYNCLYGPTVRMLVAEASAITLTRNGICRGLTVDFFHPETPDTGKCADLLSSDNIKTSAVIAGISVYRINKWIQLSPADASTGEPTYQPLDGVTLMRGDYTASRGSNNRPVRNFTLPAGHSSQLVSNAPNENQRVIRFGGSAPVEVKLESDFLRLFDMAEIRLYRYGDQITAAAGETVLTVNSTDSAAGITIMGGSSYTVPPVADGTEIALRYFESTQNWQVSVTSPWSKKIGLKTYNPPSLAAGAVNSTTVTVTGAELGDFATASFGVDLQGILLSADVSAADTVRVTFHNVTGGTIDLGSAIIRAAVSVQ